MSEHMTDPTPHETPDAEEVEEVEALTDWFHRNFKYRGGCPHPPTTNNYRCVALAHRLLDEGYRKADPARDAKLRVEAVLSGVRCAITGNDAMPCTDWIGAEFGNGIWLEAMCCVPCRVRAALTEAGDES